MNFKVNLLSTAIAASLLTACGGSSSSSKPAPMVTPAPAPVTEPAPVVEPTPELLDYTLTDDDLQKLGKDFVTGFDAQTIQLSEGLGKFGGSLSKAVFTSESLAEGEDFDLDTDNIKGSFLSFVYGVAALSQLVDELKEIEALEVPLPADYPIQLGKPVFESSDGITSRKTLSKNEDGQFEYNGIAQIISYNNEYSSNASVEFKLAYVKVSDVEFKVIYSATLTNAFDDVKISVDNAVLTARELEAGDKIDLSLAKITIESSGSSVTTSATMSLVEGGDDAKSGSAEQIPLFDELADLMANFASMGSNKLNIASFEMSDVKVEASADEYLTADSILFEDADAADYIGGGDSNGYGALVDFAYNEDKTELKLEHDLGTTTYAFIPANGDEPNKVTCVSDSVNTYIAAPRFARYECDESGVNTSYGSLVEEFRGKEYKLSSVRFPRNNATGPIAIDGGLFSIQNIDALFGESNGQLESRYRSGIDSLFEPITFSVAANGELGLAGGLKVPYQLNLNHPAALNYQAKAVVGLVPELTAEFSTLENDITLSNKMPFTPTDSAYAPTEASVKFSYHLANPDVNRDEKNAHLGSLTVNGVSVGTLTEYWGVNRTIQQQEKLPVVVVLSFADGTYPADGGLFTTVNNLIVTDCPAEVVEEPTEEVSRIEERAAEVCYKDQPGVVNIQKVSELFFAGLPIKNPLEKDLPK